MVYFQSKLYLLLIRCVYHIRYFFLEKINNVLPSQMFRRHCYVLQSMLHKTYLTLIHIVSIQGKMACCSLFSVYDIVAPQSQVDFGAEFQLYWFFEILTNSCTDCCLARRTNNLKYTLIAIPWHVLVHVGLAVLNDCFLVFVACRFCCHIHQFLSYSPLLDKKAVSILTVLKVYMVFTFNYLNMSSLVMSSLA